METKYREMTYQINIQHFLSYITLLALYNFMMCNVHYSSIIAYDV